MQITETKVKVSDLCKNYSDNGDGGVFGYDGKLTIRPAFQREFVYKDKIRLLFMLPATEKDYAEALMEDTIIRKMMRLFYIFYFIFRKQLFNYVVETQGADFMLEEGDARHDGEVILEAM